MKSFRAVFVAAAWGLAAGIACAGMEYQVIDLGTLGGTNAVALGINDDAQVVGWSQDSNGWTQAFVWQNGTMAGLGFLPGGTNSVAMAINGAGEITGYSHVSATNYHAFLYASKHLMDLGTWGGPYSRGNAINDRTEVTGWSYPAPGSNFYFGPFLWRTNRFIGITPYHNKETASGTGVNSNGFITGYTILDIPDYNRSWAFIWWDANTNGIHDSGEMKVLGTLGGQWSGGAAINDRGQIAGWASTDWANFYPHHAFLLTPSNGIWNLPTYSNIDPTNLLMRDLGVLGGPTNSSWARAINERTWVVGNADMPSGTNQAFLWRDGVMTNLNDLIDPSAGWILTDARGINENNEIVGNGLFNGQSRAYLLRQDGRITGVEPVGWTETAIYTNESEEVVTQEIFHVESHVIHWAGIWTTNVDASPVFTVEYCDALHSGSWIPFAPTSQWPIAESAWTNRQFGDGDKGFFRVRATEDDGSVSPPSTRSGKPPRAKPPLRRSIP